MRIGLKSVKEARSIYRKKLTVEEAMTDLSELRDKYDEVNTFLLSIEESTRGISR